VSSSSAWSFSRFFSDAINLEDARVSIITLFRRVSLDITFSLLLGGKSCLPLQQVSEKGEQLIWIPKPGENLQEKITFSIGLTLGLMGLENSVSLFGVPE
jgi:hypothetical protein